MAVKTNFFGNGDTLKYKDEIEKNLSNNGLSEVYKAKTKANNDINEAEKTIKNTTAKNTPGGAKEALKHPTTGILAEGTTATKGETLLETFDEKIPAKEAERKEKLKSRVEETVKSGNATPTQKIGNIFKNEKLDADSAAYANFLKNNKIAVNPQKEDLSWVTSVLDITGSKNWTEFIDNAGFADLESVVGQVKTDNMGMVTSDLVGQMEAIIPQKKRMYDASKAYREAEAKEKSILSNLVKEREKELQGVKAEDYIYAPKTVTFIPEGADEGYRAYVQDLYAQAEELALSNVYSTEDMDEIEKNTLKNAGKAQEDYNAEKTNSVKNNDDWEEKSVLPKTPDYYARTRTTEQNPTEAALVKLMHKTMTYSDSEENEADKFSANQLRAIYEATKEQKTAICYLYRTGGAEKVKEYIDTFDDKADVKNATYAVNDSAFSLAWVNKAKKMKQAEDWEKYSALEENYKPDLYITAGLGLDGDDAVRAKYLSDDEQKALIYIINSGTAKGEDWQSEGKSYFKSLIGELNKRQASDKYKKAAAFADEHPYLASLLTTGESVVEGVRGIGHAVSDPIKIAASGVDKNYDTNAPRFNYQRSREAIMNTVKDKIDSDLGDFMYDTVMSAADNVARVGVSAGAGFLIGGGAGAAIAVKYAAPVLMSGGAYQSGMKDALDRGADNTTAMIYGYASAANELVTEHIGMDNLANNITKVFKGGKISKSIVSSMMAEGGEELANAVIELVYDDMLMGEKSTYNGRVQHYLDRGKTGKDAHTLAVRDTAIDCLTQAAAGALSGGLLSAGGIAIGKGAESYKVQQIIDNADTLRYELYKKNSWDDDAQKIYDGAAELLAQAKNKTKNKKTINSITEREQKLSSIRDKFVKGNSAAAKAEFEKLYNEHKSEIAQINKRTKAQNVNSGQSGNDVVARHREAGSDKTTAPMAEPPALQASEETAVERNVARAENDVNRAERFTEDWVNKITAWDDNTQNAYQNIKRDLEAIKNNAPENVQSEYDRLLKDFEKKVKNKVRNIDSFARLKMEIPSAELLTVQNAIDKIEEEIKAYVKRDLSSAENDGNEVLGNHIKELRKKSDRLRLIQKLSDKGVRVNMYSASEANAEGILTPNGVTIGDDIYININSTDPLSKTMGHEMLHLLKNENQGAYNNIIDLVKKGFPSKNAEARISYLKEKYTEDYSDYYVLDNEMFWEEYAADVLGDMSDKNAYGRGILNEILNSDLSTDKKKTAVRAFAEGLRKLIIKVRSVIGKNKYKNYAEMQAYEFVNNAIEIHKEAAKAYRDLVEGRVSEGNKKTAAGADVKYAVGKNRIVSYTEHEKKNWEKSNSIVVYESEEQFKSFIKKVLNNEDTNKKIYFGKIPDSTAQMVLNKTGVDVSGHNIALKGYEIRKILLNSHGDTVQEAARGQEPITADDLKNIPSVIINPDDVNLSDKEYEGKPALLFEKNIDGKNYVVAYVSKKHHDIAIQTMYKKRSLAIAENADALSFTPETTNSTAPSDNTLSQEEGIVNTHSMQNEDVKYSLSSNNENNIEDINANRKNLSEDIKFSISSPVETTKNLVAVHNLTESKLLKAIELGGFAMPSIAIVKADDGHSAFGDISVVFGKESIDPANTGNKVYSGDAWTPTYPIIEYKPNTKKADELSDMYYDAAKKYGYDNAKSLSVFADESDLSDLLYKKGGEEAVVQYLKEDTKLMQLFFLMKGEEKIDVITKETVTTLSDAEKMKYDYLIEKLGEEFFINSKAPQGEKPLDFAKKYFAEHSETFKNACRDLFAEVYGYSDEQIENVFRNMATMEYIKMIKSCARYIENGDTTVKIEPDYVATNEAIRKKAESMNYDKWVEDNFTGLVEKKGIANGKDPYTSSGKRKKFDDLHYDYNIENVVRAMRESGTKGLGGFGGKNLMGASTIEYASVADIKDDAEKRLSAISEEEHQEIKRGFMDRLYDIATRVVRNKDNFMSIESAIDVFCEAVERYKTKTGIAYYIRKEFEGWAKCSDNEIDELMELVSDIRKMPVIYFEAKSERAVSFEEVRQVIIPDNASSKLKDEIIKTGMSYVEYKAKNEEDRKAKLNAIPDIRFSAPSSSAIEQRAELENHAYEIETAVIKRLEAALDTKLSEKTREAVKVYSISEAMGDHERISASREKLVDSIENNEKPMFEARTEDDGFKDYLKGLKDKVYVSDYARQGMSAADVSRTFGVGKWSGKEGLPVDVLYDNMKAEGITLPEADTLQDKLIALRDRKAEIRDVRREAMPRSEIRDIVDYAVDLEDYTNERGISEDVEIPGLDGESKTVQDAEFMNKRRELESEIDSLDENDYTQKRKLREEKNALEKNFVEKLIRQGRRRSERGIYSDFCRMDKAEEAAARARIARSENAAREADIYARVHEMTQDMRGAARALAEGSIDETRIDTRYKNAEDRARIKELSELYRRVDYTNKQLRAEQRTALNEACDILFKNASYMRNPWGIQGQIDTFEAVVNYICKVDSIKENLKSIKENMKSNIPAEVRQELIWAAEKINEVFYYPIQENTRLMNEWKDKYLSKLDELGIRKRSAESAAAQSLGEGFFNEYDLDKAGFTGEQKEKIIELANYLKETYNEVLQQINAVRFTQGEGDIKAPTFKVNKQLRGQIADMQKQVKWLRANGEMLTKLTDSEKTKMLEANGIKECAADAYFAYGKDFEKRIDWREKNVETASQTEMQQWAWNLLMRGKKYDSVRGTIEMDYFPHMEKNDTLDNILAFLNIKKTIDTLPTAISGMTENFRPNKKWSPFMQERLGNETEFDAVTGAERYFDSVGQYIYHSGDIVKIRILENYIRQRFNAEGSDRYCLSNFASYLRDYGDYLAGKQYMLDRFFQKYFGRKAAQGSRLLMNNVSKNQIAYHLGTAITNSAVYAQGIGWVIRESIYEKDITKLQYALRRNDGIKEHIKKSTFLTNRFHGDVVLKDKSRVRNGVTKFQNAGFVPMAVIDKVFITRVHQMMTGVYMSQGMSEENAIMAADVELRKLAASREYGETPLIYSANSLSILTKYTLEPVNQMRYYKSEIGRMTKAIMAGDDDAPKAAILALLAFFAGYAADLSIKYWVNKAFKKVKGYPVFTDPVQMTIDTVEGFRDGKPGGEIWLDILDEIPIVSNAVKAVNGNMAELIGVGAVANFFGNIAKAWPGGDDPDWGEVIWNGITLFNPLGAGAQAKKTFNTVMYLLKGYQENKNGQVQHAADGNAEDWFFGLLFGKSAIPSVQKWHDNNYTKLTKQSSEVFKTVVDEYDLTPEEVYDMMTEYDHKKKEAKENDTDYSVYKWVTEDIDKYGKFTVDDKYYLWNKMSKRDCPVTGEMENPEKKIAQVFIATGNTDVLIDRMSDEFSIDGHRNTTTKYYLSEEQQDKLQSEYNRILFKEIMPKYMNLKDSEDFDSGEWVEFITNAKSKAKTAAQEKAVAEGWYYDSNDIDTTPEDTFETMKQDREKTGRSAVEAFWIYCDKTSQSFIIPDWENPTKAQQILAETFVACEKEPEGVLPTNRSKSFKEGGIKYLLNEQQYEEFNSLYFMYYWDEVEKLESYSQEARIGEIQKIRDNAHAYAKGHMLKKYKGQMETEE